MNRNLNTGISRIKFKNSLTVYENFIKCTVKDYEYNLSYNPTLLSGSQELLVPFSSSLNGDIFYINSGSNYGILKDFATGSNSGSEFSPYVGSIGLYNDSGDLLALGKMAAPVPLSTYTDTTFLLKYNTQFVNRPYFTPTPSPTRTPNPTPSVTPSVTVTPIVTPSSNDCSIGSGTAVYVVPPASVSPTPSKTPSVTPSITVTPSVTPSPFPIGTGNRVNLTFTSYSDGIFTFTLSNSIPYNINIQSATVTGYDNDLLCGIRAGITPVTDACDGVTLLAGNTTVTYDSGNVWQCPGANMGTFGSILSYRRTNSMRVNNTNVSNGSTITIGGYIITIIIPVTCAIYNCNAIPSP